MLNKQTDRGGELANVKALLEQLLARADRIEAAISRLAPVSRISRKDRAILLPLLPALHVRFPSGFRSSEVLSVPALRRLYPTGSTKGLGKLFARCVGISIDGFWIERHGREGHAVLWMVWSCGVSGLSEPIKAA